MQETDGEAEPSHTAAEYENSFPLDGGRRFAHPGGKGFVERVRALIELEGARKRARKAQDEQRFAATLEALLANIVAAHRNVVDSGRFVAISLSRDRYSGSDLSFAAMRFCRKRLQTTGLVEFGIGFQRPDRLDDGHFGRQSRIRAAPRLRELIDSTDMGKRPLTRPAHQLVRINQPRANVGDVPPHIDASRNLLEAVNHRLANSEIAVRDEVIAALKTATENEGEAAKERGRERRYAGDLTATALYRVFKHDWKSGGRFYGGWWMCFPGALRPYITIDGQPVVELDYKTLHPHLLYRRQSLSLDFDPYVVPSWETPAMRNLGKRTFNRLLNRVGPDAAKRLHIKAAPGDTRILPAKMTFATYRTTLVNQLSGIQRWLGTGEGIRLQYEDSELALAVMTAMETKGITVLPIHDSFIVAARHEKQLELAMREAFFFRYKGEANIDRKGPAETAPS